LVEEDPDIEKGQSNSRAKKMSTSIQNEGAGDAGEEMKSPPKNKGVEPEIYQIDNNFGISKLSHRGKKGMPSGEQAELQKTVKQSQQQFE